MNGNSTLRMLEMLANAKDSRQFKQKLSGYYLHCKNDLNATKELQMIEEVWLIGKKRR